MRPSIGITLDWQKEGTFSKRPHHALREHYFNVVEKAGGLPFGIPYAPDRINDYLDKVDGLVIPGGFFESPKKWYISDDGKSPYEPSPRLEFDLALIKSALDRDIPILGICAGMQLMGGLMGCKMTENLQEYYNTDIDHLNKKPAEEVAHYVDIKAGTLLEKITGHSRIDVNTAHREAIVETNDSVIVNCISEDGIIEGIEIPGKRFALGVQWHPEFFSENENPSFKLFKALVTASSEKTDNLCKIAAN
ncbi:MAG: gamma-glutamyl-gamma-aminobutyrate hydrolase [Alphaproteobacteria bacterium CG11_big_fil_rev_8_21_14_0_20_39_49]|nr:MAG: gamma-glutamyl-gamma-aminobutyrate hydrolase [Alphaproteobacteria bacterium CG11_big_fil_rev_8_21_14_0_20_39_49]